MTPLQAHGRRSWPRARLLLIASALGLVADVAMAQDCRPLSTLQAEAESRGEVHQRAEAQRDGTWQLLLSTPDREHWTLLSVTIAETDDDEDMACIIAQSEQGEPS